MNDRPAVHKSIGWAVQPGDSIAHYYNSSRLGLTAISMCWQAIDPKHLRPATIEEHCQVCKILIERKENKQKVNSE